MKTWNVLPCVNLVEGTENAEEISLRAMGVCRDSTPSIESLVKACRRGELTLLEHNSFTFEILCSTVARTHLLRHRVCSFTERSLRSEEPETSYFPLTDNVEINDDIVAFMIGCFDEYNRLIDEGVPRDTARYVLPQGTLTRLVLTSNARELLHIIKLRTSKYALDETRQVAQQIQEIMAEQMPDIFMDNEILEQA